MQTKRSLSDVEYGHQTIVRYKRLLHEIRVASGPDLARMDEKWLCHFSATQKRIASVSVRRENNAGICLRKYQTREFVRSASYLDASLLEWRPRSN